MSESLLVAPMTFTITVIGEEAGSEPMSEQAVMEYIRLRLESQSVIAVLNLIRDY